MQQRERLSFRYGITTVQEQFKLAPGLKLNFNKKSVGVTMGGRGAHLTYNPKGQRTASVGLRGTGLWYRDTKTVGSGRARGVPHVTPASSTPPSPAYQGSADFPPLPPGPLDENQQRQVLEAETWISAHTQEEHALQQWMSEIYTWAGTDLARRAQAHEMVLAHGREWVQSAVDMGQPFRPGLCGSAFKRGRL